MAVRQVVEASRGTGGEALAEHKRRGVTKQAVADDAIRQELAINVPGTNATLHGPYITFRFADAPDETYVLGELVRALAEVAHLKKVGEVS